MKEKIINYLKKNNIDPNEPIPTKQGDVWDLSYLIKRCIEATSDSPANIYECNLWEADLEENWIKLEVPAELMIRGINAGKVKIDVTDITSAGEQER